MDPSSTTTTPAPSLTAEPVPSPPQRLREPVPDRSFHQILLAVSLAVVLLSGVLRVDGDRRVIIPGLELPLPGVCTSVRWFDLECPGCGLTRSFISLGHGDLPAAWGFNPAGPLGFFLVAAQLPYRGAQLWRLRRHRPELRLGWLGQLLLAAFVSLLLGQWLMRLAIV